MEMLTNSKACNQTARHPAIFFPPKYALVFYVWSHFFLSTKSSQLKGDQLSCFPDSCSGWCLSDRTICKCNIWNPVPTYLTWSSKCTSSVCTVKAGSLQIRPDFSRFPFNPPQVMGQTKLDRRKRKPRNNPQAIFFNSRILALNGSPKSPLLTSTCRIFNKKRQTEHMQHFFFFLILKMLLVC